MHRYKIILLHLPSFWVVSAESSDEVHTLSGSVFEQRTNAFWCLVGKVEFHTARLSAQTQYKDTVTPLNSSITMLILTLF